MVVLFLNQDFLLELADGSAIVELAVAEGEPAS